MNYTETVLAFPRLAEIAAEPYEPRGILNSEMALVIATCDWMGIDLVIESGRARGQSTFLLGKYLPDVQIKSVELRPDTDSDFALARLSGMENVFCYFGDGRDMLDYIIAGHYGDSIAVLLDGPKGIAALDLLDKVRDSIAVGFIHDMRKLDHGAPSPYRAEAERRWPNAFFSDDPAYVAATSWMDAPCTGEWEPGLVHKDGKPEELGSYGPTIGVFVP